MVETFRAYQLIKENDQVKGEVRELTEDDLPEGELLIRVHYSSINYKDAMANMQDSPIVKEYPFVPGIDLAGEVVESSDDQFQKGDKVIATSYEIGVSHDGGYSEYARVSSDLVIPLPTNLSLKEAMLYGTAGLTAALSVNRLEKNGLTPDEGKVLVTGATGGVGSFAIAMLAKKGYHVVASSGKAEAVDFLKAIGAKEVIGREDVQDEKIRPVSKQQWAAAVDPVGGKTLASILSKLEYNGAVAVSGLTGGVQVPTSVYPFILRGVSLLGVDSVYTPMQARKEAWERAASDLKPNEQVMETILNKEVGLDDLSEVLPTLLEGKSLGRIIVRL
ncbi:putative quinone oxidoreductase YhfP [Paraliobacillus ryukyuensis]|uniref:Putative YhdH/YhfP family quinone oxidoreductase n=1 Tax=Paraliobacillus ryukyuensis TaxID=200904 RepID=A0A366EDK1_9BACI|nr:acryloyl-CoA reductase [Paraliobacillus ryukyuensis]RBP00393.1 putative YhdH/YhfP family quinone oxidoreductase [Paraliobacillus ryukyuensis]